MTAALTLEHIAAAGARRIPTDVMVPVYEASHADDLDEPVHSTRRFLDRLDVYTQRDGFELIVAYARFGMTDRSPLVEAGVEHRFGPYGGRGLSGATRDAPASKRSEGRR